MCQISVVMPTWNAEKYLREAVDSILGQTFCDFELIVIDDASTDMTRPILETYQDCRIKVIDGPCRGISAALNIGLDVACGEYIARMDADDISYPNRFEMQVNFLNNHKEYGLCATLAEWFFPDGHTALWGGTEANRLEQIGIFDNLIDTVLCHPTVMFRRDTFEKYELRYNEEFDSTEDQELWVRAMRYTRFYNMQEVLLKYRVHESNTSEFRRENGLRNLIKVKTDLLKWLYPSGKYPEDQLNEKIAAVADIFRAEVFEDRKEKEYIEELTFEGFPKWKKVIGLMLFNPTLFWTKLKRKFEGNHL